MRAVLVIALGLVPGLVGAQGLGGAAREEASRRSRRGAEGDKPTYTNADLRADEDPDEGSPGPTVSAGDATPATALPKGSKEKGVSGGPTVDPEADERLRELLDRAAARRQERELAWRKRFGVARARLAAAKKEHDAVCLTGSVYLAGG